MIFTEAQINTVWIDRSKSPQKTCQQSAMQEELPNKTD